MEVMNFNPSVHSVKWEFGYWGDTLNNWYAQGLPKKNFAEIPNVVTTPSTSMYTVVWHCKNRYREAKGTQAYPAGIGITGGGIPWPQQSFPLDSDVKEACNLDQSQIKVDLNLGFYPILEPEIFEEDDVLMRYKDVDGVVRLFHKETGVLPMPVEWPVKAQDDWEKIKHERLRLDDIRERLPRRWSELVEEYKQRDYPLLMGCYPYGFFGTLVHLMGYEQAFYSYYDHPALVDDILETFTDLWIAVYSEVLAEVEVDFVHIWEDISSGKGSMVSPAIMRRFMVPYYKKLTSFLKSSGVDIIIVDTDGDCSDIIPVFLEGGVTGLYPFEVDCGIDLVQVRKDFPKLQMLGGVPKGQLSQGKGSIDRILKPVEAVLKTGGYIPYVDHLVPPEVPWEEFKYYREKLNRLIDARGH